MKYKTIACKQLRAELPWWSGGQRPHSASFSAPPLNSGASQVAQTVKSLPVMRETWVWSVGWEDPLEKGMVTHSGILAWRTPWTEYPGGLQSMGLQRVGHDWGTNTHPWIPGMHSLAPSPIHSRGPGEHQDPVGIHRPSGFPWAVTLSWQRMRASECAF